MDGDFVRRFRRFELGDAGVCGAGRFGYHRIFHIEEQEKEEGLLKRLIAENLKPQPGEERRTGAFFISLR